MHDGGEIDVWACYTAISVASILNILDDELVQNVGNYILSCQTCEGGIGGEPNSEAHGGYTFCGLATMILINEVHRLDLSRLIDWLVFCQGRECGFQGRTNKLVDGCYSFWQGGSFALLRRFGSFIDEQLVRPNDVGRCSTSTVSDIPEQGGLNASFHVNYNDIGHNFITTCPVMEHLFNSHALQQYILLCTQSMQVQEGGLRDFLWAEKVSTDRISVQDSSGKKVEAQILPILNATFSVRNYYVRAYLGESPRETIKYWLAFTVSVPPIGFSTYIISTTKQTGSSVAISSVYMSEESIDNTIEVGQGILKLIYSARDGKLSHYANNRNLITASAEQSYSYYSGNDGTDKDPQASGAYVFRPNGTFPIKSDSQASLTMVRGPVLDEVHQRLNPWIS
ncbi:uncharacterized protein LOC133779309 [Humulus lupulus]|uniref:uncharacterized protein LOC133779309 n=1 Tax=Humulus lupulus TaxID=3486 RepID=UPI002B409D16|nr:uncharacterized protein LOC133779309 [Humulus lupulus]